MTLDVGFGGNLTLADTWPTSQRLPRLKNVRLWAQEWIGDWYADSANHPPTEYAGTGEMWKFISVHGNPGEWQQVDIPDWHTLDQFDLPTTPAGAGFMWQFNKDIGRWMQLPIPKWREADSEDKLPSVLAGEGYMWKFYRENGERHWHQVQIPKVELLRPGNQQPSLPHGKGFQWKYVDKGRAHWEQVPVQLSCTGFLCTLRFW
ncbi:unnamed protein product [Effrenium voratum]|nr:unnamed protein product [Effrenium voratum]